MKVLIIKMTSMGDIVHTFPAITDAGKAIPDISFDWVVEENFAEIPPYHPRVRQTIPVAFRRWRRQPLQTLRHREISATLGQLRSERYDLIIDAQGLCKSAIVTLLAHGPRCGFDKNSARETWGNFIYHHKFSIARQQHAVSRLRQLFAKALNYPLPETTADYGLVRQRFRNTQTENYLVFIPNTTWATKHWPEDYWRGLIAKSVTAGLKIRIPWGNEEEKARAVRLADSSNQVEVLPGMTLTQAMEMLASATAVVSLDTGLAHLAAAFATPTVSLYGPTDPALTGTTGLNQTHLAASFPCAPCLKRHCTYPGEKSVDPPCYSDIPPDRVWEKLQELLARSENPDDSAH